MLCYFKKCQLGQLLVCSEIPVRVIFDAIDQFMISLKMRTVVTSSDVVDDIFRHTNLCQV